MLFSATSSSNAVKEYVAYSLSLSFRAEALAAAEKSCDVSRIHSHVILEALAEEVRGSTLFTTFLPLPAAKISPFRLRSSKALRAFDTTK
jgi:hypothetical protein